MTINMLQCQSQDKHVMCWNQAWMSYMCCSCQSTAAQYVAVAVRMVVYACDVVRGEEVILLRVTLRMFTHKCLLVPNVHMALRC